MVAGSADGHLLLLNSGPAKYAERGTGLTTFAAARSPCARVRNTGAVRGTMRTCCGGPRSGVSAGSWGITGVSLPHGWAVGTAPDQRRDTGPTSADPTI